MSGIPFPTNLNIRKDILHVLRLLLAKLDANLIALLPHLINPNDAISVWPDEDTDPITFPKWLTIQERANNQNKRPKKKHPENRSQRQCCKHGDNSPERKISAGPRYHRTQNQSPANSGYLGAVSQEVLDFVWPHRDA